MVSYQRLIFKVQLFPVSTMREIDGHCYDMIYARAGLVWATLLKGFYMGLWRSLVITSIQLNGGLPAVLL